MYGSASTACTGARGVQRSREPASQNHELKRRPPCRRRMITDRPPVCLETEVARRRESCDDLSSDMAVLAEIVLLVLAAFVVATLGSRLMGIRLGAWRGLLAGAIGYVVGVFGAAYTLGRGTSEGQSLTPHGFGEWVAALAVITLFGVLADDAGGDHDRPPDAARGSSAAAWAALAHPSDQGHQGSVRSVRSICRGCRQCRRAGLLHFRYASQSALATPELAQRVRRVLEESGGMLVKFGQIASTRTDILPEVLTSELASLRADAPPVSAEGVREVIETEFGEPVEQASRIFRLAAAGSCIDRTDPHRRARGRHACRGEGAASRRRRSSRA